MFLETKEIVRSDFQIELGSQLGDAVYSLICEINTLLSNWQTYRSLFGSEPERFKLLFDIGGGGMVSLESSLWDTVILKLCKLTEPRKDSKGNNVLSLRVLPASFPDPIDREKLNEKEKLQTKVCRQIKKDIKNAEKVVEPLRKVRHLRIAHRNLDVVSGDFDLKENSRQQIQNSIDAVCQPIITLYAGLLDVQLDMAPVGSSKGALTLLNTLYDGHCRDTCEGDSRGRPNWLCYGKWDN